MPQTFITAIPTRWHEARTILLPDKSMLQGAQPPSTREGARQEIEPRQKRNVLHHHRINTNKCPTSINSQRCTHALDECNICMHQLQLSGRVNHCHKHNHRVMPRSHTKYKQAHTKDKSLEQWKPQTQHLSRCMSTHHSHGMSRSRNNAHLESSPSQENRRS